MGTVAIDVVGRKNYRNLITIIKTVIIAIRSTRFFILASFYRTISSASLHYCNAEALDSPEGVLGLPLLSLGRFPSPLMLNLELAIFHACIPLLILGSLLGCIISFLQPGHL